MDPWNAVQTNIPLENNEVVFQEISAWRENTDSPFTGQVLCHLPRVNSEPSIRLIQVRDQKQARDWSLALISQGIESTLYEDEETGSCALAVEASRCGEALRVLKLYHVENRAWGLRQDLPGTRLSFDWTCLGWAVLMIFFHYLASASGSRVDAAGMMDKTAVLAGQWWRLFTALTLHADGGHLLSNLATGILFLGLVMARHGAGVGLLGAWMAGALANLAAMLVYPEPYRSLGASGMVLAMLGILTVTGAREAFARQPGWRALIGSLGAGAMLFTLTGSSPKSDLVVHLGGFAFGLVAGFVLENRHRQIEERSWLQSIAAMAFFVCLISTWMLALAV